MILNWWLIVSHVDNTLNVLWNDKWNSHKRMCFWRESFKFVNKKLSTLISLIWTLGYNLCSQLVLYRLFRHFLLNILLYDSSHVICTVLTIKLENYPLRNIMKISFLHKIYFRYSKFIEKKVMSNLFFRFMIYIVSHIKP